MVSRHKTSSMYSLNWPSHLRNSLLCSILSNSSGPRSNFSCSIWCFFSLSIRAFNSSVRDNSNTCIRSTLNYIICKYQFLISFPSFCVRGTRTQALICVGCAVHHWVSCAINKGGFLRLHFRRRRCRHTFASLWGACLLFASLWRANSCGDSCVLGVHLSKVCWGLIFCLRKTFIFWKVCWIFVKLTSICVCWIVQIVHLAEVWC